MTRTMLRCGFVALAVLGVAAIGRTAGNAPPHEGAGEFRQLAAISARLRFGAGDAGRLVSADASNTLAEQERGADAAFEAAMAELIEVTLNHPGTDAADRARRVLDAAQKAVEAETREKQSFVFRSWVPLER